LSASNDSPSGTARCLLVFALLLCLSSIVPAAAAADPIPTEAEISAALQDSFATYQQQQRQREEWLGSPAAIQEREASRHAYDDLAPAEAEALLRSRFGDVLAALNKDPARYLSDAKLEAVAGPEAATVTHEGETTLMESSVPVRALDEDRDLMSKVDVSLVKGEEGWEPVNPLTDLEIGEVAEEGVELEDTGIAVTQVGAEESVARPLGDKNLFYGEVDAGADTDLMVSPTATGFEIFDLLRSVASPETLRFHVEMPAGATLRANQWGGAELVAGDGSLLALVPKPWALDAQGTPVPVALAVEGASIVLTLDHREEDFAYPILVDPEWESLHQDWGGWNVGQHHEGLSAWKWAPEPPAPTPWWINHGTSDTRWPGVTALFIATAPGTLGANEWGHYFYRAPNAGSYLADASVSPFHRDNRGCPSPNPYYQPYDYAGMYGDSGWNRVLFNKANELGWVNLESWGRMLAIGMSTNNGTYIPCWRDLMIGGVSVWLDDSQFPYLDYVGPTPEGWVKKDDTPRTFSVSASDAGLGVRTVRMFGVGTQEWLWNKGSCKGTYEERCPASESGQITFKTSGLFYEGRYNGEGKERKFTVQVVDPTKKTWQLERPLWVDGKAPTVSLSGELAEITKQEGATEKDQAVGKDELSLPTYKLEIAADDGGNSSGVKEIKVFLDNNSLPAQVKTAGCTSEGCPPTLSMTYTLKLAGLSPGPHSLRIVVVDMVGNEAAANDEAGRNIDFEYIPATGMKEEYVLQHFRLPDGNDYSGEDEYHGPEIAVNVMNGNVVFHERDVDLETDRGDLELERVYNSQQPIQKDTQWGRGWSIAQAPELKLQTAPSPPQKATVTETGRITSSVPVPETPSQSTFSARLHATITKTTSGYEVEPVSDDEISVFSSGGRVEEVVQGDNSPAYLPPEEAEWAPSAPPAYKSSFGSGGFAPGQFKHPAGIAVDGAGNLWVVDQDNDRVQKFSPAGELLLSFGSSGTGNGQFGRPTDIAISASGNAWVTDAGNHRVQKFNSKGEFVYKFGAYGTGSGQLNGPESIAIDANGDLWIADTYNGRLQEFNLFGGLLQTVGSKGSGQGQLLEPTGIDIAPNGEIWVAEWGNNRLSVFKEAGAFVRHVGSAGAGNGQFSRPDVVEVDHKGRVWVGDQNNGRIQQFDQAGGYVTQFGVKGAGPGQFSFSWPMGIASDPSGGIWVSDTGNNRVQRWGVAGALEGGPAPYFEAPVVDYEYAEGKLTGLQLEDEATQGEDPDLDMSLSSGLVSEVQSEEEGSTAYAYSSGRLTSVAGQDGQTKFGHDTAGRLSSIALPNGTTATIVYDESSRVNSVTVDPAGAETAKTTRFFYGVEPRRTTVWGGGNPTITYDIGLDGSVLRWSYAEAPPNISLGGSLWSRAGEEIENKDHTLVITGSSTHLITSIKVIANGNSVVAEETCEDPAEPPTQLCEQWQLPWITHASEHAPGRLDLEAIVTDPQGRQTAERFFVTVPQQPPPGPEEVERPSFASIKLFREEYGLDRNKSLTEPQLNELILELLYEWEKRDFTAMAAIENWGVPMRAPELAEMEWRREYVNQAAEAIPQWAEENAASLYGGFYVDEKAGSKIYVGFTGNQAALVEALKQSGALINPNQVFPYLAPPKQSVAQLDDAEENIATAIESDPGVSQATVSISVSPQGNAVEVGAISPALVEAFLKQRFGPGAPISVVAEDPDTRLYSRFAQSGPLYAGSAIVNNASETGCTAGFSARAPSGESHGEQLYKYFAMTAGHCFPLSKEVSRRFNRGVYRGGDPFGEVRRQAFVPEGPNDKVLIDAEAVSITKALRSHSVLNGDPLLPESIQGAMRPVVSRSVCWSAVEGGQHCGRIIRKRRSLTGIGKTRDFTFVVNGPAAEGDSGGPVWDRRAHKAVGIIAIGFGHFWVTKDGVRMFKRMSFTPLLPRPQEDVPEGALPKLGLDVLKEG
jgi:YD repeat-containing protein